MPTVGSSPSDPAEVAAGTDAVLAGAFLASLRHEGIDPDPSLRLLRSGGAAPGDPVAGPAALGARHEELATAAERTDRGAWYTPAWLAEQLVARAVPGPGAAALGPILDPACGGGVFLVAAVERLVALGWPAAAAVGQVRGRDIDPVAAAVTEAALWWWAARRGAPAVPAVEVGDSLACSDPGIGTVVGNPPFLGQLRSVTAVDGSRREVLRERFGGAVRAYTDPAWLFALRAAEDLVTGGRAVLVQPRSILAARDAAEVRARIDRLARVEDVVVVDDGAFDAAVATCAPVLVRTGAASGNDWTGPLADAAGIPPVALSPGPVLGDLATTHAGFRDEFYGTAAAVGEGGGGPRLVTVGAIDPLRLLDRPQRFGGRRWRDPRVDVGALTGRAARWAELQSGPKLLVATQTRVLEAVVDADGTLYGSVPAIVVRPHDVRDLWRVAAALQAPAVSAWALRQHAGTGRSVDACRPTASLLASVPLPADRAAWDHAAVLAQRAAEGRASVSDVAAAAQLAYGRDDAVLGWWERRRPQR